MKKWELLDKSKLPAPKTDSNAVLKVLFKNRKLKTKKEMENFLNPKLSSVTVKNVGINIKDLEKSVKRIKDAIKKKQQIIVFGDYDVDGISGAAILWETLNANGAKVLPYIPNRIDEGYGLSVKGIENLKSQIPEVKLIITVDNGIVANAAVDFANKNGIDVIITDHHVPGKSLPKAYSIVHTTKLCGAGVGWMLALQFEIKKEDHIELVALAAIADLVPLTGANRTLVKFGLEALRKTERLGLLELFRASTVDKNEIGVYEVGHMIAPRLNAMGRLESAMDSLRLLCTTNKERARDLAEKLSQTNLERQKFTQTAVLHASTTVDDLKLANNNLIFLAHESYQQGVIGLVAGRLVEEYYLPSIVVSKGDTYSKASARSISGLNIIEFIRSASDLLVDAGGHPMAAGFTVETSKIEMLQKKLQELALTQVTKEMLERSLRIDCELPADYISPQLYEAISQLEPFGMANPIPVFATKDMIIESLKTVGQDGKHLKLTLKSKGLSFEAIGFGMGNRSTEFKSGSKIDIVYSIDENEWNGNKSLQLKLKDLEKVI